MRSARATAGEARSGRYFHLFVYDRASADGSVLALPAGCERVAVRVVAGTLYDIDGDYRALVLAGAGGVEGEVWRCPVEVLPELDQDERVVAGLLRRVGVQVEEFACWAYVVGPGLAPRLVSARRIGSSTRRAVEV
jgi:gamma-glutamylcyclotransferase (GGCT)/AIG2-like uncharacterized protein YtfP